MKVGALDRRVLLPNWSDHAFQGNMSLRKRPTLTPALLAANRANAQKSTGPRTVQGKNRIVLNALKHGRHARTFRDKLLRARSKEDAELFQWILEQVRRGFRIHGWQDDELGGAVGAAGVVRAAPGRTAPGRLRPAAWKGASEVSSAGRFSVGAALDAPPAGRGRNKPGICREINR